MRWRRVADVVVVVWLLVAALLLAGEWNYEIGVWDDIDTLGYALIVAFHLPLFGRGYAPVPALLVVCSAATVYLALDYYHSVVTFAIALAVYSVAEHRQRRVAVLCALLGWAVLLFAQRLVEQQMKAFGVIIVTFLILVAWAFGDNAGRLAERGRQLADLSERLRREQQERAHEAVSREQGRIARELHDVVAHHMSVISVQSGLARYVLDSDLDTVRTALGVISGTAHEALNEMRRLLAALRVSASDQGESAQFDSAPGLDRLPQLMDRVRAAGASVQLAHEGTATPLPPGLALCVYRVVQESLTNVLKHADPPIATVLLRWRPETLTVLVTDEGRPSIQDAAKSEAIRHGLIGMRERARIYGGKLTAGPRPDRGFEVCLTLPIGEHGDD